MLIGKLAGAAGVNIQTIRFYEREGLLRPPQRSHAGYRNYEAGDLEKEAVSTGVTRFPIRKSKPAPPRPTRRWA